MSSKSSNTDSPQRDKHPNVRLLSKLIENKKLGWWMLGGSSLYFLLHLGGLKVYICPLRSLTGWKCPGCGLTGGAHALLKGDLSAALHSNWFTLFLALFWIAVAIGLIIPEPARKSYIAWVRKSEEITKWPYIFGLIAIIYTLTRNSLIE